MAARLRKCHQIGSEPEINALLGGKSHPDGLGIKGCPLAHFSLPRHQGAIWLKNDQSFKLVAFPSPVILWKSLLKLCLFFTAGGVDCQQSDRQPFAEA
ncbi:hypothetical protein WJU23_17870 [Prosthecobacter sp. SYSU 5D2]|uniref:hypothetical protein n=1 Tax=Prosthecobacter sp. SYSU 5D2 TaxID=3134134 RepID=UPI0031FE8959